MKGRQDSILYNSSQASFFMLMTAVLFLLGPLPNFWSRAYSLVLQFLTGLMSSLLSLKFKQGEQLCHIFCRGLLFEVAVFSSLLLALGLNCGVWRCEAALNQPGLCITASQ